ncbi:MAG: anthranilate synthase component I family protein, partial [Flavobacteriaceae bacterium]|nr:anthranilate synthase component I family protein [Flavobacteriaceae bacterium]
MENFKEFNLKSSFKKILADTLTPVSIYLKIRDKYPNSILLESSDYRANDNSFSYICFNPIASFEVQNERIVNTFPDKTKVEFEISESVSVIEELSKFSRRFKVDEKSNFKFIHNGLFGYTAYDAVRYFEDIEISKKPDNLGIPDMYYAVYRNIVAINHFKNEVYIFSHSHQEESNVEDIHHLISSRNYATFNFASKGDIASNLTDGEYMEHVELAKRHCARGDVFQLVLSRKFSQNFEGD